MSEKFMEQTLILSQEEISKDIYSLWIRTERIAGCAEPGQFLAVYCDDESRLLPRPISICEIDRDSSALRLVYRIAGEGTREFSAKKSGDSLRVLGPLGNGFPMEEKKALLVGGGIGIPPMLELAKQYPGEKSVILGYNDRDTFLLNDFSDYDTYVATMDGSVGTKGTVIDAIRENGLAAEVIMSCGPAPMLRALKEYAAEQGMECYVSLEERMACGIGACLGCVCRTVETDEHTNVHNRRICTEGPVFNAAEIDL